MDFLEYVIAFSFGYLACVFGGTIEKMLLRKEKSKTWSKLEKANFKFSTEDYIMVCPMHLEQLIGGVIPRIIQEKSKTLDFQDIVIERGQYDLHFIIDVGWKKK